MWASGFHYQQKQRFCIHHRVKEALFLQKTLGYEAKHTYPPRAEVNNVKVHPHFLKCFHGAVLT